MRFSSTTADCVSFSVSPFFRLTESPPAERPMYCSPSRPEVRILAELSLGNSIAAVDIHRHDRLEGLVVETDLADAADDHAGAFHRRADLQPADIVEPRVDPGTSPPR